MVQDTKRRSRYFVDRPVQGALLFRAARYWVLSLGMVAGLTVLGWLFVWPGIPMVVGGWEQWTPLLNVLGVGLAVTVVLLPVVLYDFLKMTNRFVGPIFRLHRSMVDLADGKPVRPIKFRDDDYWQDLALAFNRLLESRQAECSDQQAPALHADEETLRQEPAEELQGVS